MNPNLNITQLKQAIQQEIQKEKEAHPFVHQYQDAHGNWHVFRTNIYDWKGAIPVVSGINGNKVKIDWVEPGPAWQSLITTKTVVYDPQLGHYVYIDVYNRLHPKNQVKQPDLSQKTIEKLNKLNEMSNSRNDEQPRVAVKRPWGVEYWKPDLVKKALAEGHLQKSDVLGAVPSSFIVRKNGNVVEETPAVFFKEHPELNPFKPKPKATNKSEKNPQTEKRTAEERTTEKPKELPKEDLNEIKQEYIRSIEKALGVKIDDLPDNIRKKLLNAIDEKIHRKNVKIEIAGITLPDLSKIEPVPNQKSKKRSIEDEIAKRQVELEYKGDQTSNVIERLEIGAELATLGFAAGVINVGKSFVRLGEEAVHNPIQAGKDLVFGTIDWFKSIPEKLKLGFTESPFYAGELAGEVATGEIIGEGIKAATEIAPKPAFAKLSVLEGVGRITEGIESVKEKAGETLFGKIEIENIGKAEETIPAKPKGEIIELKPHVVEYLRNKAKIPKESERYGVQMSLEGTPADVEALEEFKKSLIERRFQDLLKEHLIEENMIKPEEAEAITLKPTKPEEVAKSRTTVIEKEKLPSGEIMEVPETYAQITLPEVEEVKEIKVKRGLFGTKRAKVVEKISKIEPELKPKIGQPPISKESKAYLDVFMPKKTVQAPLPIEEPEVKVSYFPDLTPLKQKALEDLAKAQKEKWENAEILELSPSGETAKVRFVVKGKGKTYTFEELVPIDEIPEEKLFKFEEEQFGSEELLGGEGEALLLKKKEVPTKFEIVKEEPEEGLSLKRISREVKKAEKEAKEVKGKSGSLLLLAPPKQKQKEKQSLKLEDIYKQQLKLFEKFKPKEMAKMKLKVKQMQKQKTKQKTKTKLKAPEFSKIKNLNFTKNLFELNNLNVKTLSDLEVGSVIGTPVKTTTQPISTLRVTSSVSTNVIEELGAPFSPPSRGRRPHFGMIKKDSKGKQSKSRRGKAEWNIYNVFGDPLRAATSVDKAVNKLAKEFLRG